MKPLTSFARRRHPSPMLCKGPGFDLEAPSAAILASELEGDFRDRGRLDEKAVGLFVHRLARSGQIDSSVHNDQRDMDARRAKGPRHRVRGASLRLLSRSKSCGTRHFATRCACGGKYNGTARCLIL